MLVCFLFHFVGVWLMLVCFFLSFLVFSNLFCVLFFVVDAGFFLSFFSSLLPSLWSGPSDKNKQKHKEPEHHP